MDIKKQQMKCTLNVKLNTIKLIDNEYSRKTRDHLKMKYRYVILKRPSFVINVYYKLTCIIGRVFPMKMIELRPFQKSIILFD